MHVQRSIGRIQRSGGKGYEVREAPLKTRYSHRVVSLSQGVIEALRALEIAAIVHGKADGYVFRTQSLSRRKAGRRAGGGGIVNFFVRVGEGLKTMFTGMWDIVVGSFTRKLDVMNRGHELFAKGLGELKDIAVDLGQSVIRVTVKGFKLLEAAFGSGADAPGVRSFGLGITMLRL